MVGVLYTPHPRLPSLHGWTREKDKDPGFSKKRGTGMVVESPAAAPTPHPRGDFGPASLL